MADMKNVYDDLIIISLYERGKEYQASLFMYFWTAETFTSENICESVMRYEERLFGSLAAT